MKQMATQKAGAWMVLHSEKPTVLMDGILWYARMRKATIFLRRDEALKAMVNSRNRARRAGYAWADDPFRIQPLFFYSRASRQESQT